MLKIIGEIPCAGVSTEFGDYVPFAFQFLGDEKAPHFYWRAGNMNSTLFEVAIDRKSGKIEGGSLISFGPVKDGLPNLDGITVLANGVPIVCTENWPGNRYMDDVLDFQIYVDSSRIMILFSDESAATKSVGSGG
ncbi:hypothetical protein [Burkholderia sp. Ac-20379]|uniref:hypothetical protein n=1 Tax=Burkholderia sp. Ac-20379 TaxID=2703900 RepID=UPI00197F1741|nr:hypothetical protein [Burkholderia sp. Ac-20379]MBN3726005.1 hypothetical protein [Burkholderia sp. Ac-20379]